MTDRQRIYFRLLVFPFVLAMLMPYISQTWFFTHQLGFIYYFLVAFLMSFGLVPLFYKLGLIMGITDEPGGRHHHKDETPRTGGMAIYITFVSALHIYTDPPPEFLGLFWAITIVAGIGILDDIRGVPATIKLGGQILATIVLMYYGIIFSFIPDQSYWRILSIILTFLWIIGITNAINFLDGLDGLASGLAIVISLFYAAISWSIGNHFVLIVSLIFMGAVSGFFLYNFRIGNQALIFLGDTGSTIIGFTLAALAIYGDWGVHKSVDLAIPVLLLAVPITDLLLTNIMRIVRKKVRSLRELLEFAGNDHLHHRLKAIGLRPKAVVITLCLFTVLMGLLSLLLKRGDYFESIVALSIGIIIFYTVVAFLIFMEKRNNVEQ